MEEVIYPDNIDLTDISLPHPWVLYLYDKNAFKKMANKTGFQSKPYKEIYTLTTVNDLIYILQVMECKLDQKVKDSNKINLDANDYIIMRKGIEPIWEDIKNSNGGTFTVIMNHAKGYDIWSTFIMYIIGETLTCDMENINGITVSYISTTTNLHSTTSPKSSALAQSGNSTFIKIWDGRSDRNSIEDFIKILPVNLFEKIKNESLRYYKNNTKNDFNKKLIVDKLNNSNYPRHNRGGFSNYRKRY